MSETNLVDVVHLTKEFSVRRGLFHSEYTIRAVDNVSFSVGYRSTLGLVGESGSGKTTIAMMIARILRPTSGTTRFQGKDIWTIQKDELRAFRRKVGYIFQDPFESFNPGMSILDCITEPLAIYGTKREERLRIARELLQKVGLSAQDVFKFPREFSGGQLQRIAIARAISLKPLLIVADEPVSSLDISTQAKILDLMKKVQKEVESSYLIISHDLAAIRSISDKVIVLYAGRIVECGTAADIFINPLHPYTKALISDALVPDPKKVRINPPILLKEDSQPASNSHGCRFFSRCIYSKELCKQEEPKLESVGGNHLVRCFFWDTIQ